MSEANLEEHWWLPQSVFHFSLLTETWEQQISQIPPNSFTRKAMVQA